MSEEVKDKRKKPHARLSKCKCWQCNKFTYLYDVVEGLEGANEEGGQYCKRCATDIMNKINNWEVQ